MLNPGFNLDAKEAESPAHGYGAGETDSLRSEERARTRVAATWRGRLRHFVVANRVWLICLAGFLALSMSELYGVQQLTLVSPQEVGPSFAFWAPKIRGALDLLFLGSMCWILGRGMLAVVAIAAFLMDLGLLTYQQYFMHPLSILTVFDSWREGTEVAQSLAMFSMTAVLVLLGCLCAKLLLLISMRRPPIPRRVFWSVIFVLVAGYAGLTAVAYHYDPLHKVTTTRGVGRLGIIRGYAQTWLGEIWFLKLPNDQVLASAKQKRQIVSNNLTPVEATIPIRKHLVVIQVESLDNHILDCTINGHEVTPFLNRLKDISMYYRVRAIHNFGSADADFVMLTNAVPSIHANTYKIPGYPFENCLPQFLSDFGYSTSGLHGKSGEFYSRRSAYSKMGFRDLRFLEELDLQDRLQGNSWGIYDDEVFRYSSRRLRDSSQRQCHFIITLTTHTPYVFLRPDESLEIFSQPKTKAENYVNNMHYIDRTLRDYLASLRDTTVLIYADHTADVSIDSFKPDRVGAREYVPVFVYDTETDLAKLQKTRGQPIQTNGTLNMLDISNYLRAEVKASAEAELSETSEQDF